MSDEKPDPKAPDPIPEDEPTRVLETVAIPIVSEVRIQNYRIVQKLGEGGMGEVYEAQQEEPVRRRVALKVIKRGMDTGQALARFESERQALALMNHPNIARVFDGGATATGQPYFAMEYIKGVPITDYCDMHRLNVRRRLELFQEVCEGVQHAHQKGIIHRDLKPSNVLVRIQSDRPVPKIIDFGVAKAIGQRLTEKTAFTQLGEWIGTPEYMSPEQAEMSGLDIDTRTDVYSLGVLLYELLVGAKPFDSKELRRAGFDEIRRKIREDEPPRPSTRVTALGDSSSAAAEHRHTQVATLARQLRGELDWIVMRALEKDRTRRYNSPLDLAADLRRHLNHEPVLAHPPTTRYRVGRFVRRHRFGVLAASLVTLALVLGVIGTGLGLVRARRAEAAAKGEALRASQEAETAQRVSEFLVSLFQVSDPGEAQGNSITAREILDRGAEEIETELADQPLVRAKLQDTIGTVYRNLGLYDAAEPTLERALATREQQLQERPLEVSESLISLGDLYRLQGKYEEAATLLERALSIREQNLGTDDVGVAEPLLSLGIVFESLGRYDEAEAAYRRGLEIRERVLGPEDVEVARSVNSLAVLYQQLGRLEEAEPLLQRSLKIRERNYGADAFQLIVPLNNLGVVYNGLDRTDEATGLFERVLKIQQRVLGDRHPDVASTLNNLGDLLSGEEQLDAAERNYLRAIDIWQQALGSDHPDVAIGQHNLANLYLKREQYAEAEPLFRRALAVFEAAVGENHPYVAYPLASLGQLYTEQGLYAQAESLFQRSLSIRTEAYGNAKHPEVVETLQAYAVMLRAAGREAEADALEPDINDDDTASADS